MTKRMQIGFRGQVLSILGSHLNGHDADDDGYDDTLLCGRGYRWSSSSVYPDAAYYLVMGRAALGSDDDVTDVARVTFTEPLFSSEEYGTSTAFGDIDDDGTVDMAVQLRAGTMCMYIWMSPPWPERWGPMMQITRLRGGRHQTISARVWQWGMSMTMESMIWS